MSPTPKEKARGNGQVTTGQNQERREPTTSRPQRQSTTGRGIFHDALFGARTPGDIRFELEKKLAACLVTGGTNGFPIEPHRIKTPTFRSLVTYAMVFKSWTIADLVSCTGEIEAAASAVLLATLDNPVWGQSDYILLDAIERIESIQQSALKGGLAL